MRVTHVASRYRVIRELGRGGMGVVYVVEHLHTGERLALKLLHGAAAANPEVIARFKREARAAAQIRSEHVVRVTDADVAPELDGAPFFVMELLEGFDLEKAIEKRDRLHPDAVIAILSQVARALDRAHAIGIVHRDLKPENIFLQRREGGAPVAKVLDFGISKFASHAGASSIGATADGTLMGTPAYMAPEQARGMVDSMGPATDIWAMGLIAIRLLTADSYWTAESQGELMVQILVAPMPRPSERWPWLGDGFDAWFARSCNRDPGQRWASVSEQVAALAGALAAVTSADGATMETLAEALRDSATGGTVPSSEAALPEMPSRFPNQRQHTVGLPGATTGGPETVTVTPSTQGRRSRAWMFLSACGIATLGLAALAPRLLHLQDAHLTENASSAAFSQAPGHASAEPPGLPSVPPDTLLGNRIDAGGDTAPSGPKPADSVEPPRPAPPRSQQPAATGPRRGPSVSKPRTAGHDDPMAP